MKIVRHVYLDVEGHGEGWRLDSREGESISEHTGSVQQGNLEH